MYITSYAKFTLDIGSAINNSNNVSVGDESIPFAKYQWAKASDSDIEEYRRGTYRKLSHTVVPVQLFIVRMLRVRIVNIDIRLRDNRCNVLSSVGKLTIPTCRFRCS